MDDDFFVDFTSRAGTALEAEDRLILGSGMLRNEKGGILRLNNERYYQFILWRAMLSRWRCVTEYKDRRDLVLFEQDRPDEVHAEFELKRWMSGGGERELPGFILDIRRLKNTTVPRAAFVVFSANPRGGMLENIEKHLEKGLKKQDNSIDLPQRHTYCFPTIDTQGKEVEFWLGVWPVANARIVP